MGIYEKVRKVPKCTSLGKHGMKLTQRRRKMSTFRSTKVNENCVLCLYRRCAAFGEGAASAGCHLEATKAQEVAAAITIIALLKKLKISQM